MDWISRILLFVFIFSCVVIIRELADFLLTVFMTERKLELSKQRKWLLALSISYFFTIIFTGF